MTLGMYIINEKGFVVPCHDPVTWGRWMEAHKDDYHLIDSVAGIRVSTVFLALDHQYGKGEPILWETMIFNDEEATTENLFGKKRDIAPDLGQWRFSFKEEAYAFHHNKVDELKSKLSAATYTSPTRV